MTSPTKPSPSSGHDSSSPNDHLWRPRTSHANGHVGAPNGHGPPDRFDTAASNVTNTPKDPTRSPAPLALRAHLLGLVLGQSALATVYLIRHSNPLWRLCFFLAALSLFHSLEYYTTALYNPESATTTAFLLNNGRAYNIAHFLAFLECFIHQSSFPSRHPFPWTAASVVVVARQQQQEEAGSSRLGVCWLVAGFALLVAGQMVRTVAMAQAGRNFNHVVQSRRKEGHVLVTEGVYSWLRHPSYFGFFWWGLGTQMVLGNWVCLVGYAIVLWRFFRRRIEKEEQFLIGFFGDDYVRYRQRTRVGIPLIP